MSKQCNISRHSATNLSSKDYLPYLLYIFFSEIYLYNSSKSFAINEILSRF